MTPSMVISSNFVLLILNRLIDKELFIDKAIKDPFLKEEIRIFMLFDVKFE